MKILIVCKALESSYAGGIQSHVSDLARSLASRGHRVHILTAGNPLKRARPENNTSVTVLPYWPAKLAAGLDGLLGDWSFNLFVNLWVVLFARTFDVIHAHGRSGIALHRCGRLKQVVQTVHGIFTMEQSTAGESRLSNLDRMLHAKWAMYHQRRMHQYCGALIAVSEDTLKGMLDSDPNLAREKVHVIPNGVLRISGLNQGFDGSGHILFAGRLSETKGLEKLIEAMQHTRAEIQLSVIGDGPLRAKLELLAKTLGVGHRVHFQGCKPRQEVYGWMRNSIAVITPSVYEPQGIVVLEAAALGKAIVAANTSGIPEFIEDRKNGLLVSPGSPVDLARAINEISERPHYAATLGLNARRKVMLGYQWKNLCADIVRIYQLHAA